MRYSSAVVFAIAGLAAAQTSTTSSVASTTTGESGCGSAIDAIINNCLSLKQSLVTNCGGNDWDCLCDAYTQVDTCYDNCPTDPSKSSADQQKQQYCAAADSYGSTTSSQSNSGSSTATVSSPTDMATEAATTTGPNDSNATNDASETTSHTPNGAPLATPVIGLAAVFGIAALL